MLTALVFTLAVAQPPPSFPSTVALVGVDVGVVDADGRPIPDLGSEVFSVLVDGRPRRVPWVQWRGAESAGANVGRGSFSSNLGVRTGRLVAIVVDQGHLGPGDVRLLRSAVPRLLASLLPADRVALFTVPPGSGPHVDFTADTAGVERALERLQGQARIGGRRLGLGEALAFAREDSTTVDEVLVRECGWLPATNRQVCAEDIRSDALMLVMGVRQRSAATRQALRSLAEGLARLEAAKIVALVSEGYLEEEGSDTSALAAAFVSARATVFVVQPQSGPQDASVGRVFRSGSSDQRLLAAGLETLAGLSGGALLRVTGSAEAAFERIARELGGEYRLGFEPEPGDADGRSHAFRAEVRRPGATVRGPRSLRIPRPPATPEEEKDALGALLRSPSQEAELPLKVATWAVREAGTARVRVLVGAEIGRPDVLPPSRVGVAFVLRDREGRPVASGFERVETPAGPGAAAFVGAAEVPSGAYRLRLAALDSRGLRGSVDHEVSAALASAGELELSDLVITTASGGTLRPDVDPRLGEGTGLAYLELYASDPARLSAARVTIEIASGEDGPPLASRPARMSPTPEPDRLVAQGTLPADGLPAGGYIARAVVCVDVQVVRRLTRQFWIER